MSALELLNELRKLDIKLEENNGQLKIKAEKGIINEDILLRIKSQKDELITFLKDNLETKIQLRFPFAEKREYYDLSSSQLRIYVVQQMNPESIAYNMPQKIRLQKKPDVKEIENHFKKLIFRHECLRTSFIQIRDEIVQVIHSDVDFRIQSFEAKNGNSDEIISSLIKPFNLANDTLIRVNLIITNENEYVLFIDLHHIISDGISQQILENEFNLISNGKQLDPIYYHYKDYSKWQYYFKKTDKYERQKQYWLNTLNTDEPYLNMPFDKIRPQKQEFKGKMLFFSISKNYATELTKLAKELNTSINILLTSIYALLLFKYTRQETIIIGSIVAGRNIKEAEKIIGVLINYLALKIEINNSSTFLEYFSQAYKNILSAFENQDYQFEELIRELKIPFNSSRNPLFGTMFIFHNQMENKRIVDPVNVLLDDSKTNDIIVSPTFFTSTIDFKMDVFVDNTGALSCSIQYNTELIFENTMRNYINNFKCLINTLVKNKKIKISDINIFSTVEEQINQAKRQRTILHAIKQNLDIVFCSSFVIDPISENIKKMGLLFDYDISVKISPYNQVFQELLNTNSILFNNNGVNVIMIRFEDWIYDKEKDDENICKFLDYNYIDFIKTFKSFPKKTPNIIGVFPISDNKRISISVKNKLTQLRALLIEELKAEPNTYIIDHINYIDIYNVDQVFDDITEKEAQMPFSEEFNALVAALVFRKILAIKGHPFKVIVLDCDNTLWRGICGEGNNINIEVSIPFQKFQRFLLQKHNEGMLLTLCSKNNENDVWSVFERNIDMVLKKNHFVTWRINWNLKSDNIKSIAEELDLDLNSFIFIDDNPFECNEVIETIPQILTFQLPEKIEFIPDFFHINWAFDKERVTDEDTLRSNMYLLELRRKQIAQTSTSFQDFLSNLQLKINMRIIEDDQINRVAQLSQRVNQFNLSNIRRTSSDIKGLLNLKGVQCWVIEVEDRFGDYGLVGNVITKETSSNLVIDSFLLSCRTLGRGVEDVILYGLGQYMIERNLKYLIADYHPTERNVPFLKFLDDKWKIVENKGFLIKYELDIADISPIKEYIKFDFCINRVNHKNILNNVSRNNNSNQNNYSKSDILQTKYSNIKEKITDVIEESKSYDTFIKKNVNNDKENRWDIKNYENDILYKNYYIPIKFDTSNKLNAILNKRNAPTHLKEENIIEDTVMKYPDIKKSIAIRNNDNSFTLFYLSNTSISTLKLRQYLMNNLKANLIPLCFIRTNYFPLLSDGNVDRITFSANNKTILRNKTLVATSSKLELEILQIWKEVLNVDEISLNDDFFKMGGTSIMVIKIISKLYYKYGVKAEFDDFFNQNLFQFINSFSERLSEFNSQSS